MTSRLTDRCARSPGFQFLHLGPTTMSYGEAGPDPENDEKGTDANASPDAGFGRCAESVVFGRVIGTG